MALVTWKQSWMDGVTPIKNGAISIYLSGTTTSARVFDVNDDLHDSAPQIRTDITGYTEFQFDDDDYPENQAFDLVCVPDPMFNPTTGTKRVDAIQPYLSSGSIRDRDGGWELDIDTGISVDSNQVLQMNLDQGLMVWDYGTSDAIRLQRFGAGNMGFYPETDDSGHFEIGVSTNTFQYITLRAEDWIRFYVNNGSTYVTFEDGGVSSCNAWTVVGCSPALAILDDEDIEAAVEKVSRITDAEGNVEIGEHGFPQLKISSLPDNVTNKHDLYRTLRKENCDLINWEDYCLMWDEGEFDTWRGGSRGIDAFTLSIALKQERRIKALEAQIHQLATQIQALTQSRG